MKRKTLTIQMVQNGLLILKNNNIISNQLKSVANYKVINKELFIQEFEHILKTNKINNNILTDNIKIIIDATYSEIEKEDLSTIFKELSFNKIEFIDLLTLFILDSTELLIDISNNSIKIYFDNEIILSNIYFYKYKAILKLYLKNIKDKYNIKCIKLFGNYKFTNKFIYDIEKICGIKTYLYAYPSIMPIKLLT